MNVWNLTEGWPIGAQFNRYGYHVFILTYQVTGENKLLEKNLEDFSRALQLIRNEALHFHVHPDLYITCGFSAGGYLISLWNMEKGYPSFGLPKPRASFPVYPFISLKLDTSDDIRSVCWYRTGKHHRHNLYDRHADCEAAGFQHFLLHEPPAVCRQTAPGREKAT